MPASQSPDSHFLTIVHGLRRKRQKYGMVTMCVGTGMGAAGIFEAA